MPEGPRIELLPEVLQFRKQFSLIFCSLTELKHTASETTGSGLFDQFDV
jgi:hypothetical protein